MTSLSGGGWDLTYWVARRSLFSLGRIVSVFPIVATGTIALLSTRRTSLPVLQRLCYLDPSRFRGDLHPAVAGLVHAEEPPPYQPHEFFRNILLGLMRGCGEIPLAVDVDNGLWCTYQS